MRLIRSACARSSSQGCRLGLTITMASLPNPNLRDIAERGAPQRCSRARSASESTIADSRRRGRGVATTLSRSTLRVFGKEASHSAFSPGACKKSPSGYETAHIMPHWIDVAIRIAKAQVGVSQINAIDLLKCCVRPEAINLRQGRSARETPLGRTGSGSRFSIGANRNPQFSLLRDQVTGRPLGITRASRRSCSSPNGRISGLNEPLPVTT